MQPNWPPLESEEEVVEQVVVGEADSPKLSAENPPAPVVDVNQAAGMANYDAEEKNDGEKATEHARAVKVEFDANDIKFWFAQLEDEMTMASVGSQWLKKTVLQRNLPVKQKEDVKALLTLQKADAGQNIYLRIKNELIRIYAPKPSDSYRKALTRTMTGLPSQLGYQLVDDVCKKSSKMDGCCCAGAVLALWSDKLPVSIRAHTSNMTFSKDTYKAVFEAADKVYLSSQQVSVSAMTANGAAVNLDETQPAFHPQNLPQQQVAAQSQARGGASNRGGRGNGRGGRNNNNRGNRGGQGRGGGGRGGGQGQGRGPRHSSNPPDSCCDRHYRHGPESWYCTAPTTCPWVNKCTARPTST